MFQMTDSRRPFAMNRIGFIPVPKCGAGRDKGFARRASVIADFGQVYCARGQERYQAGQAA